MMKKNIDFLTHLQEKLPLIEAEEFAYLKDYITTKEKHFFCEISWTLVGNYHYDN